MDLGTKAKHGIPLVVTLLLLTGCTDSATRIANDIQSGAEALRNSPNDTLELRHISKAEPDGCNDSYKVQFSRNSAIVVWCIDSKTGATTSSHITTYHLNFVKVPESYVLEKQRGEPLLIDLSKTGNDISVENVR